VFGYYEQEGKGGFPVFWKEHKKMAKVISFLSFFFSIGVNRI
jgi:hypothetical protein